MPWPVTTPPVTTPPVTTPPARRRTLARIAVCAGAILAAAAALWTPTRNLLAAPPSPLLHERLPPAADAPARTDQPLLTPGAASAGGDTLPDAILTAQGRIDRPKLGGADLPTYQPKAAPRVGLDRRTGADLNLNYQVVFDPSVAPFKREVSLDSISPELSLTRSEEGLQELAGQAEPRDGHELFWGHLRLILRAGERVVLPSVAPTSQILSWQATPPLALKFWRDRAGNFGVSSPIAGEVELRYLMDAPSQYFAAPLGVWRGGDDPETPALDSALQARASRLWAPLGISPSLERGTVVSRLVEYFRGFEPGEPPAPSGDGLADLILSRRGVCRHRALGFLVLAHSLGIPAHYVMNDAHAFIEVWVPAKSGDGQWQRIDLGGGSESLELHSATGKHLHQPQFRDPFARPEAYVAQTGQVSIDGVPVPQTFGGARQVKGAEGLSGASGTPTPSSAADMNPAAAGVDAPSQSQWLRQRAEALTGPRVPPAAARDQPPSRNLRTVTSVRLDAMTAMAWLGEPLGVSGRVLCADGAAHLAVEVWMIDPSRPTVGRLLGTLPTDPQGHFSGELPIASDLDPQVYDVIARFAGDPRRAPSDSGP